MGLDPPSGSFHQKLRIVISVGKERVERQAHGLAFLGNLIVQTDMILLRSAGRTYAVFIEIISIAKVRSLPASMWFASSVTSVSFSSTTVTGITCCHLGIAFATSAPSLAECPLGFAHAGWDWRFSGLIAP